MNFMQIWNTPNLRNKILITFSLLVLFRLVAHITIPGIDPTGIKAIFEQNSLLGVFSALEFEVVAFAF